MKKTILLSVFFLSLAYSSSVTSQQRDFVWGYFLEFQPCSDYLEIYQTICVPSNGGFCQVSAQNPCPGPPYFT